MTTDFTSSLKDKSLMKIPVNDMSKEAANRLYKSTGVSAS